MAEINHGDIRYYTFKPPDKRRPVLVLTRNSTIPHLNEITIAAITSTVRNVPSEVLLSEADGMPNSCVINLYHLQTVQKHKIGKLITTLSAKKMKHVGEALLFALGFDDFLAFD